MHKSIYLAIFFGAYCHCLLPLPRAGRFVSPSRSVAVAWLISEALKMAGHFIVEMEHAFRTMWGHRSCGRGHGCPDCEEETSKAHIVRLVYDMLRIHDEPPPPP